MYAYLLWFLVIGIIIILVVFGINKYKATGFGFGSGTGTGTGTGTKSGSGHAGCSMCGGKGDVEGFAEISMQNTTNMKYPLIDYFIKASAHSAYDSSTNKVSLTTLKTVIRRGCRWLDFDVFSVDHLPVVGLAVTPGTQTSEIANTLPFDSVMEEVFKSALTTTGCPNSKDPLFINLRIRSSDTAIYPGIQQSVSNNFGSALFTNFIDPSTLILSKLAGRVVLVLDVLNSDKTIVAKGDDSYQENADIKSLRSIAGLLCGHAQFPLTTQSIQLKQSPVPVMRVDPITQEIRIQREMGYQSESFVSAPTLSRDTPTLSRDISPNREGLTTKAKEAEKKRAKEIEARMKRISSNPVRNIKPDIKTRDTKPNKKDDKSNDATNTNATTADTPEVMVRKVNLDFQGMRDTSATHFRCSIPDFVNPKSAVNPSVFKFIADYGVQVVPFRFYRDDAQLEEYELLFANNGHVAFMPLSKAILMATQV